MWSCSAIVGYESVEKSANFARTNVGGPLKRKSTRNAHVTKVKIILLPGEFVTSTVWFVQRIEEHSAQSTVNP